MQFDALAHYKQLRLEMTKNPSYSLDTLLREGIPEGKTICNKEETNWHRHVELNGPGPEAYVAYNIASIVLEERLCSK